MILLRNLNHSIRVCNDTRMRALRCGEKVTECEILTGKHAGRIVRIPMKRSASSELPSSRSVLLSNHKTSLRMFYLAVTQT